MLDAPRFTRTKENFTCEHCEHLVQGNGFTNHCPVCLWSKHVDVNPGDRAATCGGLMKPIGIEIRRDNVMIMQKCETCGHTRPNKASPQDDQVLIRKISVAELP